MRHWTVNIAAALACSWSLASAQSMTSNDDAVAVEQLDVIELDAEQLTKPSISVSWDCDVLLLNTSQRYRPTSCKNDVRRHLDDELDELQVERIALESAPQPQRKNRN